MFGGKKASMIEGESSTNMVLRAEDGTSAGDNLTFLKSELRWEMGDDGRERVLDADGNGYVTTSIPDSR